MANILIIGCGAIGTALAKMLTDQGHKVTGLRRNPPANSGDIAYIRANINSRVDLETIDQQFDQLFYIVSADGRTEQSYREVYVTGLNNVLARFGSLPCIFVSSTSVYGQTQGEWIDEDSVAEPDNLNSQLIRLAEQRITALNPDNIVVRFSGIYGRGREYLLNKAKQSPSIQQTPPYFTNRIHQDDCIQVLAFLLNKKLSGMPLEQYYLASDDDPATMYDVMSWLAEQLHCPKPLINPVIANSNMNKRCSNQRLKALGYRFSYSSYKEGYGKLITKPD